MKKINADLIEDIQFLRLSLELSVVRMACEQGLSDESRDLLQKNIEEQKACIDLIDAQETMMELDDEFHRLLFQAVGKSTVYEMIRGQTYNFDRLRMLIFKTLKTAKNSQTVHDHLNILYAIEQHDWKLAHTVMTTHLSRHIEVKEELEKCYPDYF